MLEKFIKMSERIIKQQDFRSNTVKRFSFPCYTFRGSQKIQA